ncbi:hypothetical protein CK203_008034 [Vitis vinifera]|uniref:TFIIF beta subunit N-terminal domain-containing protein n=1 Tax=Vitis vinifera TaxID=29760 RepID=A0A438K1C7_VITVI|nr:hypothetical protein CK203_008034 [Vitis vinifera]
MEEEQGNSSSSNLETGKAERSVWLMKCPLAVSKSWQSHSSSESQPVAKVVLSLDPLRSEDPSALEVPFPLSILPYFFFFHFLYVKSLLEPDLKPSTTWMKAEFWTRMVFPSSQGICLKHADGGSDMELQ